MAKRAVSVAFNSCMAYVPYRIKYPIGTSLRAAKAPYRVIEDGDTVVQVGAARDLLDAGRCRAVHFARLVGHGHVVVIEADPWSADALENYAHRHGLAPRVILFRCGAWSERTELKLLFNLHHPASGVMEECAKGQAPRTSSSHGRITVPVNTLDSLLEQAGVPTPRVVSITTNGAELEILKGMQRCFGAGLPYLSLAPPRNRYASYVNALGYDLMCSDDRGFFFKRRAETTNDWV